MKVLLVDPDSTLLPEVQAGLGIQPGLDIYCAPDAETAIQHAQALGGVDVLLTEAFLPGMDGFTLHATLLQAQSALRTLFLTVYDLSSYTHALNGALVLQRPLAGGYLLAALEPIFQQLPALPPTLSEGKTLGTFHLLRDAGTKGWIRQFAAVQIGLNRSALVSVLDAQEAINPTVRAAFLADAGAKARILHPTVLAVYEAGEADGWIYYASERLEAPTLQMLLDRGEPLPLSSLLLIAKSVAEALQYIDLAGTPHHPLTTSDILLSAGGIPRILNPAIAHPPPHDPTKTDLALLGSSLLSLLPATYPPGLQSVLQRTQPEHPHPLTDWTHFLKALGRSGTPAILEEAAAPPPPAPPTLSFSKLAVSLAMMSALGIAAWSGWTRVAVQMPSLPEPIAIPAGRYLVGRGTPVTLPAFWIDQTEISIGQYAHFLIWADKNATKAAAFNHPDQPPRHSHRPDGWQDTDLALLDPTPTKEQLTRRDLPVTGVTWWDAYAFAKWAGRDLPTQEQWEAAARGARGLMFPWGDEADFLKANVKATAKAPNGQPADVETQPDISPLGVVGMAGNVAEWTATKPSREKAIVKGGHYQAPLQKLDSAVHTPLGERKPFLGFRTISLTPPESKP